MGRGALHLYSAKRLEALRQNSGVDDRFFFLSLSSFIDWEQVYLRNTSCLRLTHFSQRERNVCSCVLLDEHLR